MRVAALYDVHGNLPALDAVLRDVRREAPDVIVVGGDVAAGPMPRETLDRLLALEGAAHFLRGNTDRMLVDHFDGVGAPADATNLWTRRDAWAAQRITRAHRDVLASLSETLVLEIDGIGPTRFCHGSPRSDEERITPGTSGRELDEMLAGIAERVVVCGHTHVQFDRAHGRWRIVNAGSVGLPSERRPGAYWALLGPDVELRRSDYDVEDAVARIRDSGFPAPDDVVTRLTAQDR